MLGYVLLATSPVSAECRFWGAVGEFIPREDTIGQLLEMPNSLKVLGETYGDGWSVGYYETDFPVVLRGHRSSVSDAQYDVAVHRVAKQNPGIVVAHLRKASSGCVEGVPNPHPFKRKANGKNWLFGHNGTILKQTLIDLIGNDYLNEHPPQTCNYDPPASWIDSELYFIFLLREIERQGGNVEQGLKEALSQLHTAIGSGRKALNFFLTDGQTLWAYKRGPTLYYYHQLSPPYSAVSSSPPGGKSPDWKAIKDDTLIILRKGERPEIVRWLADFL